MQSFAKENFAVVFQTWKQHHEKLSANIINLMIKLPEAFNVEMYVMIEILYISGMKQNSSTVQILLSSTVHFTGVCQEIFHLPFFFLRSPKRIPNIVFKYSRSYTRLPGDEFTREWI